MNTNFLNGKGRWHYFIEQFIASVVLALLLSLAEAQSWMDLNLQKVIAYILYINWVILVFIALVDHYHLLKKRKQPMMNAVVGLILLEVIIVLTTSGLNLLFYLGSNFSLQNISGQTLGQHVVMHCSYGVLLGAFCFRYIYVRDEWLKQQSSELNAKIQALQARIHPHFLFNSLNSVVSLIATDPDRAEQMLIDLSRLFRASFQELKLVNLSEEIKLCQYYLAIEKQRLGDRLQVEWNIQQPDQLTQVSIPILTLQPLLENSIFHGVEKKMINAKIGILVEILQNQVTIVITNPFIDDRITDRESNGIALDNVKQRLKAHFGYGVQFRNHAGNGIFTTLIQYQFR